VYNTLMQQDEQPNDNQPKSSWQYNPEMTQNTDLGMTNSADSQGAPQEISWTASEFIAHDKDMSWYGGLGVVAAALMLLTFVITGDYISSGIVLIMIACFGIFAARKPRTLPYRVDEAGLHIDKKTYSYHELKSFSLIQEGGVRSIQLMPLKRFMPPISIYMDPADEEKIIDVLANYLPMEQCEQELIEKLMRRLRF
jgi:hypothetical protein